MLLAYVLSQKEDAENLERGKKIADEYEYF